jgi:hypothetical protein
MSAIFFFGISAVSFNKRNMIIGLSLGVPWFLVTWVEMITPNPPLFLSLAATLLLIPFYILIVIVIFTFILKSKEVTENVLYGAVAIYLLIGGLWMSIYLVIETLQPGSFIYAALGPGTAVEWVDLLYYSFTTLTTLGYGDIVPVSLPAKHFAVTQAIIGVMYLAIIISRLIGLFITQARTSASS